MPPTGATRSWLRVSAALVGVSLLTAATFAAQAPASPHVAGAKAADGAHGNFAGLVEIGGGRRLYLECRGSGGPTVVFESGAGNGADIWSLLDPGVHGPAVLPAIARTTRVCAYDRPGTSLLSGEPSRSDPMALRRPVGEIVADLHALLRAADVPGPYVLVGHSLGGMITRLYAGTYPGQVAGFVSIDAAHEILYETWLALLTPEQQAPFTVPGLEIDIVAAAAEMRRARVERPLRPMPMFVLEHSRDRGRFPNPMGYTPDWPLEAFEAAFQAAQDDLTTMVPDAEHIIATRSEHYIHTTQPDLVINAIRRVLDELRPVAVRCRGGSSACRARVDLAGGASDKRVTIRLSDPDLRLVSVRPNRRSLRGDYGLSEHRLRRGGSRYLVTLDAAQSIPRNSHLTLTFRAISGR
jgi:pimeloyl-ACP methyl ester carboxylesterase